MLTTTGMILLTIGAGFIGAACRKDNSETETNTHKTDIYDCNRGWQQKYRCLECGKITEFSITSGSSDRECSCGCRNLEKTDMDYCR